METQQRQADPSVLTTLPADEPGRGRHAERPSRIPARGWKDVLARVRVEVKQDKVTLLSAGVAFYALLALVPALIALISLYGLVADPTTIERQSRDWLGSAPQEVRDLLVSQLQGITRDAGTAVGISAVIGITVAVWSASSGMAHMLAAINTAYDEDETRGFVRKRALALLLTSGAVLFVIFAVGVIAVLPALLADTGLGAAARVVVGSVRWAVLLVGMLLALSVMYRYGPDRDDPAWRWITPGAVAATTLWLVASAAFSVYTANFAKYNETYGSLGAVVVLMLWLFITVLCVILGAELNAEIERQTLRDTTIGPERPLGSRGAEVADTVGATAEEMARR